MAVSPQKISLPDTVVRSWRSDSCPQCESIKTEKQSQQSARYVTTTMTSGPKTAITSDFGASSSPLTCYGSSGNQ